MKLILRSHLSGSLENASITVCNENKWRFTSCLSFLWSVQHDRRLLMLVWSPVHHCLPHEEGLAAQGGKSCNSSSVGIIPLGEGRGAWAQYWEGTLSLLQRRSRWLWCSWPFTWQPSSTHSLKKLSGKDMKQDLIPQRDSPLGSCRTCWLQAFCPSCLAPSYLLSS